MSVESFGHELRQAAEASNRRRARLQRTALAATTVFLFVAASALLFTSTRQADDQLIPVANQSNPTIDQTDSDVPVEVTVPDESADRPDTTSSTTSTTDESGVDDLTSVETTTTLDRSTTKEQAEQSSDGDPNSATTQGPEDCTQAGGELSVEAAIAEATTPGQPSQEPGVGSAASGITFGSVRILGFDPQGQPASVFAGTSGLAVVGNRYDSQIDFDQKTGSSEILRFEFSSGFCAAVLSLNQLTTDNGSSELGRWTAFDKDGKKVESGPFETVQRTSPRRTIEVILPSVAFALEIEAVGYSLGNKQSVDQNNSDFSVETVEWVTHPD